MSTTTLLTCRACGEHSFFGYVTARDPSRFVCEVCGEKAYVRTRARERWLRALVATGLGLTLLCGAAYVVATATHASVQPHE